MINEGNPSVEIKEGERIVPYVLIFDVDGVLTHPSEKRVTEEGLLHDLIKRLKAGDPLVLNTGRAVDFIDEKILDPLEHMAGDKTMLTHLFAVGEKGAVSITYNNAGERTEHVDQSISVPHVLQTEARRLVEEKFSDIAFYDATKRTMISVEMHDGVAVEEFRKRQKDLNEELKRLLEQHGLDTQYKVDPSRIATDVESRQVGKALGVRKALEWLAERKIKPEKFITFGDSLSDIAMADELHQRGLPVQFVFVGERELLADQTLEFPVTYSVGQCEAGTMEYLESLK